MLTSCLSHTVVAYLGGINYMIFRNAQIFIKFYFSQRTHFCEGG
jgi:hypothetical protein